MSENVTEEWPKGYNWPKGKTGAAWALCGSCDHVWPVVFLPMEAELAARTMMAACCPSCGDDEALSLGHGREPAERKPEPQQ